MNRSGKQEGPTNKRSRSCSGNEQSKEGSHAAKYEDLVDCYTVLVRAQDEKAAAERALEMARAEIRLLQAECKRLRREGPTQSPADHLGERVSVLQRQLGEEREQVARLQRRLEESEGEAERLRRGRDDALYQLEESSADRAALVRENNELRDLLRNADERAELAEMRSERARETMERDAEDLARRVRQERVETCDNYSAFVKFVLAALRRELVHPDAPHEVTNDDVDVPMPPVYEQ